MTNEERSMVDLLVRALRFYAKRINWNSSDGFRKHWRVDSQDHKMSLEPYWPTPRINGKQSHAQD